MLADALTFLDRDYLRERVIDPEKVLISFIAVDLSSVSDIEKSVRSVERIGYEIGRKFEIIVAAKVNSDFDYNLFRDMERKIRNLSVVRLRDYNNGMAKKVASSLSMGEFLIFFDPSEEYDLGTADLIVKYLEHGRRTLLVSDFMVIPRRAIVRHGGFRNLVMGEDIDLLARLSPFYDFIAYPTGSKFFIEAQGNPLVLKPRGARKILANRGMRLGQAQSDQFLACNYGISDLRLFSSSGRKMRLHEWLFALRSLLASKLFRVEPPGPERNNFVFVMDTILESLILKDYRRIRGTEKVPILRLSERSLKYLMKRSDSWTHVKHMDFVVSYPDE